MKTLHNQLLAWKSAVALAYDSHPEWVVRLEAFRADLVHFPDCVIRDHRIGPDGQVYVILGPAPRDPQTKVG